jgi:hypothetical protein
VFDRTRKSENDNFLLSERKRKAEEAKNEEGSQKQGGQRGQKAGNLPVSSAGPREPAINAPGNRSFFSYPLSVDIYWNSVNCFF